MARNITSIVNALLGTPSATHVAGPQEARLSAALEAAVEHGLIDLTVTWGPRADEMSREELAGEALKILRARASATRLDTPPRTKRASINVRDYVAGL